MKIKNVILLIFIMMVGVLLPACSEKKEVGANQVAWKVGPKGAITTQTSGTYSTTEYRFSKYLELSPTDVAIGQDNEIVGPGGSYPLIPNPSQDEGVALWNIKPAFCTDGTIAGVIGYEKTSDETDISGMHYELMNEPGCYPYPDYMVRKFIVGPVQMRTQTNDVIHDGKTGVQICSADRNNDICDGTITGLVLLSSTSDEGYSDPNVKGYVDFDFIGHWNFTDPKALWEIGDPYEFLVKMVINKVRGNRTLVADYSPLDFENSRAVEVFMIDETMDLVNLNLGEKPFELDEVRVRGRGYNITDMQLAEAEYQKTMQSISNDQAQIAATLERDQALLDAETTLQLNQITSNAEIAAAEEAAQSDHLSYQRLQAIADEDAGLAYVGCISRLFEMQEFNGNGNQVAGPTNEEMKVLAIGCMPEENVAVFSQWQQPTSFFINPLLQEEE